jgi:hypothetical protein
VIVASDLLELAASVSLDSSDTSASRDKLKPNALLMRKDLRDQSPVGRKAILVQARRLTGTANRPLLSATPQIDVK